MKKINKASLYLAILSTLMCATSFAQSIVVQQTLTPKQMVEQVLAGQGVTISNVSYNGSTAAALTQKVNVSYYAANGSNFPISSGVLLSSGNGQVAMGPNNVGSAGSALGTTVVTDPDLQAIAAAGITNGVVLEFDFVPSGDSISFRYLFASEEYEEFAPPNSTLFNDVFGFFISGPGISGPYANGAVNIAELPSPPAPANTPVSINNVNPITNSSFYVSSDDPGEIYDNTVQYDGTTVILTARTAVQCHQTYHIKLCISNVGDQGFDSGVFLEANSFKSNVISFSAKLGTATSFTDTLLAEGCVSATMMFIRPLSQADTSYTYYFEVSGTADPNADIVPVGDSVHFVAGQDTIEFDITPIADSITESDETITLTGYSITECGDTIYNSVTLWITDHYDFTYNVVSDTSTIMCLTDSALVKIDSLNGSIPPFSYSWSTGINDTLSTSYLLPVNDTLRHDTLNYFVKVTDGCGYTIMDTATLIINQTLAVDTTYSMPTPCGKNEGAVVALVSGITGPANGTEYTWQGPGKDSSAATYNATVWQNISAGWYYFKVKDQVCTAYDSAFVDIANPPNAQVSGSPLVGSSPLTVNFANNSQNANSYFWYYGDGDTLSTNSLSNENHTYTTSEQPYEYQMYLVAVQGDCKDTAYLTIQIPDIIPPGVIETANVFTPNGDGINDTWHFSVFEHIKNVDVTILNRWGNVVYKQSGTTINWTGKDQAGKMVAEGTYFYIFDAVDFNDKHTKGQGFIQMIVNQ